MATVAVNTQVPPGDLISKKIELDAKVASRMARAVDYADVRVIATTTDASAGAVANLNDLGFTFPTDHFRVIRTRAWGRGNAAAEFQYIESVGVILGQAVTPIAATTGTNVVSQDVGTVAGAITYVVASNKVEVRLTGQAAQAMNWIVDIKVDDPVPVAAGS